MNERILSPQLLKLVQAAGPGYSLADPVWVKKFAELIVKECMELISNESEKVSGEWRCKDGQHIWWKVKEHFGVE